MKSMDTPKKTGIMARLRNSKGFSLIEMAIVLVIIGIIIAAIIKGQDLITNAHAKKVISAASSWRNLTVGFMDRNGRYPGDINKNGIIGDQVAAAAVPPLPAVLEEQATPANLALSEIASVMPTAPTNPVVVGSSSFYIYLGSTTTTDSGVRNAMIVCGAEDCQTAFTADQLEIIKSMDTAIDGDADAGLGQFRVTTALPALIGPSTIATGQKVATFTAAVASPATTAGTTAAWATGATVGAAIWLFDKPF